MPGPRGCLSRSLPLPCVCVCAGKFARNLKLCYAEKKEAMQMQSPHMATGCAGGGGKGQERALRGHAGWHAADFATSKQHLANIE